MKLQIGHLVKQPGGFSAFIPAQFPVPGMLKLSPELQLKLDKAGRLIGKLDGVSHTLPDVDFFLTMFVHKDASSSVQIEGTKATIVDAIEKNAGISDQPQDVSDIVAYVRALNHGLKRLQTLPMSLRLLRELHEQVMRGARQSHYAAPGEFRKSQNWIGGTMPSNATYVPPPASHVMTAMDDLEKFIHDDKTLPLLQAGLLHAQFETIHPFLDGNGRVGRLLVTMQLYHRTVLERPVLFLSSYFNKHQQTYYQKLRDYSDGALLPWLDFFLDGVIETAANAIVICKKITKLREVDMAKIQALAKRESESAVLVLQQLFKQPIVKNATVAQWTGFSRPGAQKVIDRFIKLDILSPRSTKEKYDRTYVYKRYLNNFLN
ncbi:MAG: Fic family protein [bacterium]|nr:Fic family protein [bacterium]